jgi:hypothetical protein
VQDSRTTASKTKGTTMNFAGIGSAELVVLCFNFAILAGWPLLALLALFSLRGRGLAGTALALWVLIAVTVPFLGTLACFILRPGNSHTGTPESFGSERMGR